METVTSGLVNQVFLRCVEDCLEPIMLTDKSGRLTYVNPAWVTTYGYSKQEAIGQTPRLLRSKFQTDAFYKNIWATILDPKVGFWKGELSNRAKDGHIVPVLLTITPYRDSSGEVTGYMGIAMDLSEQKKMEQQILHQDRMASIGLLAGGLAHEIGNPMGVIRGRAELVLNQLAGNESVAKNLEVIISQIDRISGLIQSLLRVSRVPDHLVLKSIPLSDAVRDVVVLVSEECRKADIRIEVGPLDFLIQADSSHMQQLLLNIFINSIHAIETQKRRTPESAAAHKIAISARADGDGHCVLSICDTGCGIASEHLDLLFKPFFTTKDAGKGTGLGLTVVAKLVDELGGKVTVSSAGVGLGACFQFEFPGQAAGA